MSATRGIFDRLQEAFAEFLVADVASGAKAYFTDAEPAIPVFSEQLASLQQRINDGLRRTGLSVLVRTVTAEKGRNNLPGKIGYGRVLLAVLVGCTPNANPSGLKPATVAEKIVWVARKFSFRGVTPEYEGTELLPKQFDDQVHYAVLFSMRDLTADTEPVR